MHSDSFIVQDQYCLLERIIITLLLTLNQLTESKPYVNTRRLSFGEQMTWRFGGWRPMVSGNARFQSEDLSSLGMSSSASNGSYSGQSSTAPVSPTPISLVPTAPQSLIPMVSLPSSTSASVKNTGHSIGNPAPQASVLSPKYRVHDVEQVKLDEFKPYHGESKSGFRPHGIPVNNFGKPYHGPMTFHGRGGPVLVRPHGHHKSETKPVKDAEAHAYRIIKELKERGRDIRKDYGVVEHFPSGSRNLYPKVSEEGGKRYVTVPVAIETDHDKVLTQNDIKDIEKEVLKIIPEVESGLVEGAVKNGAHVIELRPEVVEPGKNGRAIRAKPGRPGQPAAIVGPSPIVYDNLATNAIKSRISSIFRPLLSKFRPPTRSAPSYSTADPKNLNVIHLIAHQDRLPAVLPVDRLVPSSQQKQQQQQQRGPQQQHNHGQQQQQQQRYQQSGPVRQPLANLQYKIIHPPQMNGPPNSHPQHRPQPQPQPQHGPRPSLQSFVEYSQIPNNHEQSQYEKNRPQSTNQDTPYQVIEIPRGYEIQTDHLVETQPQVVPVTGDQLVDLQANQYNHQDDNDKSRGPSYEAVLNQEGENHENPENEEGQSGRPYPTTGAPSGYDSEEQSNYDQKSQQDGEYGSREIGNINNHQQSEQQYGEKGHQGDFRPSTDYSVPSQGPSVDFNRHESQEDGDYNQSNEGQTESYQEPKRPQPTMTPSVDYAEAPKIELLNGQLPNFPGRPQYTSGELDTKMLINLISNQIPSLGNVLKEAEPNKNEAYNNNESNGGQYGQRQSNQQQGDSGYDIRESDFGSSGYSRETYLNGQDQSSPQFGDRIRNDEVIYAKAEHYDDRLYQGGQSGSISNHHNNQGLYLESSNSQEVRVKSNSSTSDSKENNETFTFVKLGSDKPVNGKVIFGDRLNLTEVKNGNGNDVQLYHAYYGSADHKPLPGYVKLTMKEFKELFKDADVHYNNNENDNSNKNINDNDKNDEDQRDAGYLSSLEENSDNSEERSTDKLKTGDQDRKPET